MGPGGDLYVADAVRDQILERHGDGSYSVLAGTETAGFWDDGGPATSAEFRQPTGMALGADGTLYIADSGNGRVRAIQPNGTVSTVAGDGGSPAGSGGLPIVSGSATTTAIGSPTAVAIGPDGSVYFAETHDLLERTSGHLLVSRGPLRAHDTGDGLTPGTDGTVIGLWQSAVYRITTSQEQLVTTFLTPIPGLGPFWPQGVAVSSDGTMYLDQDGDSGVGPAAIVSYSASGQVHVLWRAQVDGHKTVAASPTTTTASAAQG